MLYAATDTQVWVSIDDGDHWNSLRLDMPAISVRDIEVKDDNSCMCSDLVAGTHGRGFWILDDVTPLRQAAEAAAASSAYLFKPETGIRIRFNTNDPTPWPPELPAGENPPEGAIVDYYLPADANEVKVEFLNGKGRVRILLARRIAVCRSTGRPRPKCWGRRPVCTDLLGTCVMIRCPALLGDAGAAVARWEPFRIAHIRISTRLGCRRALIRCGSQ